MDVNRFVQKHLNSFQTILLGFGALILIGALLLSLPIASSNHQGVPFLNALFTSASAACVTGLVVYDTAIQWSVFGKIVILILIQIGGAGVVTMIILAMLVSGKQIGIFQRLTMQGAVSALHIGGIVKFTKFFLKVTLLMEAAGALLLFPFFAGQFGVLRGACYAVFHSVSAFCNAGFDLMGIREPYSSLTAYTGAVWLNVIIMILIIIGGLGYLTWQDLMDNRFTFSRLRLQTKIILTVTLFLITVPFLYFVLFEFRFLPWKERILASLFQSVTPRTAGFNTVPYDRISETGQLITVILMLTGGAPGSTAGGLKVTTVFVLASATSCSLKKGHEVVGFKRKIDNGIVQNAFTLLMIYLGLLFAGTVLITLREGLPVMPVMFECASALGTVGLTTGITPGLHPLSKLVLIAFMFLGRTGGITVAYAMLGNEIRKPARYPSEKITVG